MDPIITEEIEVTLRYALKINVETGELLDTKFLGKTQAKRNVEATEVKPKKTSKKNTDPEPKLILEENKYILTQAAAELMGVEPDCKIDIKYEKRGKETMPVIGDDEVWGTHNGNRLTKTLTVACRGSKNQELSKFGTEFMIVPHDKKPGLFILSTGSEDKTAEDEIEELLSSEIDIQDLIDETDANITEVNADVLFQL